jgi:hypothetical protein
MRPASAFSTEPYMARFSPAEEYFTPEALSLVEKSPRVGEVCEKKLFCDMSWLWARAGARSDASNVSAGRPFAALSWLTSWIIFFSSALMLPVTGVVAVVPDEGAAVVLGAGAVVDAGTAVVLFGQTPLGHAVALFPVVPYLPSSCWSVPEVGHVPEVQPVRLPFLSNCCSAAEDGQELVVVRLEPLDPSSLLKVAFVGQELVAVVPAVVPLSGHVDGAARALDINNIAMAVVAISVTSIILFVLFIFPSFHLDSFTLLRIMCSHDAMLSKWNAAIVIYKCT